MALRGLGIVVAVACILLGGAALLSKDPAIHSTGGVPFIVIGLVLFVYLLVTKKVS